MKQTGATPVPRRAAPPQLSQWILLCACIQFKILTHFGLFCAIYHQLQLHTFDRLNTASRVECMFEEKILIVEFVINI